MKKIIIVLLTGWLLSGCGAAGVLIPVAQTLGNAGNATTPDDVSRATADCNNGKMGGCVWLQGFNDYNRQQQLLRSLR